MSLGGWALAAGAASVVAILAGAGLVGPVFGLGVNVGLLLGIVGVVLGIRGMRRDPAHRGSAIGGLVLGALSVLFILIF